jgi:hypothetical protein
VSLYNRLFGENEYSDILLGFIGVNKNMFMRYRDCYLNKEGTIVTILTRLGGVNRRTYKQVFNNVKQNPNYVRDYDDDYDDTYCYFEFKVENKYLKTAKIMAPKENRLSVGDMFKKEIEESQIEGSPASKRMEALANEISEKIEECKKTGNNIIDL